MSKSSNKSKKAKENKVTEFKAFNQLRGKVSSVVKKTEREKLVVYSIASAIIIVLLIFAVLLLCGVFSTAETRAASVSYMGRVEDELNVRDVTLDTDKQYMRSKDMVIGGNKGKFGFYCLTDINLNNVNEKIPVSFTNPSYNDCTLIVTVTDGNGKVLYRSLGIEPGKCIENIKINNGLITGNNKFKMYVTAFENDGDGKSFTKIGNLFTTLNISVER